MSAKDTQVGGNHYKGMPIEPVEFITKNKLGFLEGCVIKRMCRWRAKNGIEDLRKAIHEIELLIEAENERIENENATWTAEQAERRAKERLAVKLGYPMIGDSLTPEAQIAVRQFLSDPEHYPARDCTCDNRGPLGESPGQCRCPPDEPFVYTYTYDMAEGAEWPTGLPNGTVIRALRPVEPFTTTRKMQHVRVGVIQDGRVVLDEPRV